MVKAKKHLGQHFLKDENVAQKIADTLTLVGYDLVLEIGPGMGVLTKYLLRKPVEVQVVEIDRQQRRTWPDEGLAAPAFVELEIGRRNDVLRILEATRQAFPAAWAKAHRVPGAEGDLSAE